MKMSLTIFSGTLTTLLFFSLATASAQQNNNAHSTQPLVNPVAHALKMQKPEDIKQFVRAIKPAAGPDTMLRSHPPYWEQTVSRSRSRSRTRPLHE